MDSPLKILIVHNHYQQRGGEDSVFETECAMLEAAGHTVICYEKHNDEIGNQGLRARGKGRGFGDQGEKALVHMDEETAQQDNRNESHATKLRPGAYGLARILSLKSKISTAASTIWSRSTYLEITALIRERRPDVVHCHNTFPLISPSVYWAAARQGVPVVQTLHNYRLICLGAYLFRDRRICEDCLGRSPLRGVIHRCYRNSLAASFTVAAMLVIHRLLGTYRNKVTTYIALTEFARQKFIAAGLPAEKIVVKPNAIAASSASDAPESREWRVESSFCCEDTSSPDQQSEIRNPKSAPPIVLYVGRLSPEKGVDVLINAWKLLIAKWQVTHPALSVDEEGKTISTVNSNQRSKIINHKSSLPQLHIIGDGPERASLESLALSLFPTDQKSEIRNQIPSPILFFGSVPHVGIAAHMQAASVLVVPSIWYEQFAITPLEAMIQGTPVIVSDCARHSTILEDGKSGFVFKAGSPESLSESILHALSDTSRLLDISANAQISVSASLCMCDNNVQSLCDIYREKC